MIGRRALPAAYVEFNQRWGAPHGRPQPRFLGRLPGTETLVARRRGPFALQANNSTRAWEYPWAFGAVPVPRGTVVDLGGALSGFQVALDDAGARVINVDPFTDYGTEGEYGAVDPQDAISRLNRTFGTTIELRRGALTEAALPTGSVDVVYSISTIEHLTPDVLDATVAEMARVLAPGGHAVLTIDLFLDLAPFTARRSNRWGTNIDVHSLIATSGLDLIAGDPAELMGSPAFDPGAIQGSLAELLIGDYPALAQCLVLQKPSPSAG